MNEDGSIKKEPQTDQHLDSCRDQSEWLFKKI